MSVERRLDISITATVITLCLVGVFGITLWPRVLDAYVRSAVVKVRVDLNALVYAMEMYNYDYAEGFGVQAVYVNDTRMNASSFEPRMVHFTNPVRHEMRWGMVMIPNSVFAEYLPHIPYPQFPIDRENRSPWHNKPTPQYYVMQAPPEGALSVGWEGQHIDHHHYFHVSKNYHYLGMSTGPKLFYYKSHEENWQETHFVAYEPSNGTMSHGFIYAGKKVRSATE